MFGECQDLSIVPGPFPGRLAPQTSITALALLGNDFELEQRQLPSATVASLFAGQATFQVDSRVFDTNTHAGMHFLAFARDNLNDFYHDRAGNYYAFYKHGLDVGLALTRDGVNFADKGVVLPHDPRNPVESSENTFPSVWKDGRTWYMVTEAIGTPGGQYPGAIALAVSSDGIAWAKRGLILQHVAGWERANIGTPYLIKRGAEWYLYYTGFDGVHVQIGVAIGTDLYQLGRISSDPIITTTGNDIFGGEAGKRSIIQEGATYYMVYEVSSPKVGNDADFARSNFSTTVASSTDLLHWNPLGRIILPTSYSQYGQNHGYAFDGPEWFRTPDGQLRLYFRTPGPAGRPETQRATLINIPSPRPLTFQAETDLFHQIGRRDGAGWSVHVGDPINEYMCYGPYTTGLAPGSRTATFRLTLDNVTADNNRILTLDVFDAASGQVLARRDLTRRQFVNPFQYQDFSLSFVAAPGQRIETRTFWYGGSYVNEDYVRIN